MIYSQISVPLQVTIGGQDWTVAYKTFSVQYDKRSTAGIVKTTGSLSLVPTVGMPGTLNPRLDRAFWSAGQSVLIDVFVPDVGWQPHPAGFLYILKEPLPSLEGLQLQLGCQLALLDIEQDSDAPPEVQQGYVQPITQVINGLLGKGGCSALIDDIDVYPAGYISAKGSGSYIAQAGGYAFSCHKLLWQDGNGDIRAKDDNCYTVSDSVAEFDVRQHVSVYEAVEGGESPKETVIASGSLMRPVDTSPGTERIYEQYGDARAIKPESGGGIIITKKLIVRSSREATRDVNIEEVYEPAAVIVPENESLGLILSSRKEQIREYEASEEGRLTRTTETVIKAVGAAVNGAYSAIIQTTKYKSGQYLLSGTGTTTSLESETRYYYRDDLTTEKIVTESYAPKGEFVSEEYAEALNTGAVASPLALTPSAYNTTTWVQTSPKVWERIETTSSPPGSSLKFDPAKRLSVTARINARAALSSSTVEVFRSTSGQETPPAPERRKPRFEEQDEQPLEGRADFQLGGPTMQRKVRVDVPYAVSKAQLNKIALNEGSVLIGRRQGQRLVTGPWPFMLIGASPMQQYQALEPDGTVVLMLADGLAWSHEETECAVGFDGIWLGTIAGGVPPELSAPSLPAVDVIVEDPVIRPFDAVLVISGGATGGSGGAKLYPYALDLPAIEINGGLRQGGELTSGRPTIGGGLRAGAPSARLVTNITDKCGGLRVGGRATMATTTVASSRGGLKAGGRATMATTTVASSRGGPRVSGGVSFSFVLILQGLAARASARPGQGIAAYDRNLAGYAARSAALGGNSGQIALALPLQGYAAKAVANAGLGAADTLLELQGYAARSRISSGAGQAALYTVTQSTVYDSSPFCVGSYANLNDGSGTSGAGTALGTDEFIKADFGTPVTVSSVTVGGGVLPGGFGGVASYLNGRLIQWSTDDINWNTVATVVGIADSGVDQFLSFGFTATTARYWRLFIAGNTWTATTEFRFS